MSAKKKKKSDKSESVAPITHDLSSVVLTDEQRAVVESLLKIKDGISTLGGLAGTGKSTVVSYLMKYLRNFACCAFTGKAAEVLRTKGVNATTIHSLIYYPDDERDPNGDVVFNKKNQLSCQGIIVDEASMVSKYIYDDLVSFGLPVIFVGDHGQLEPVGEDLNLMRNPDYKLETIHRNAGDIAKFAHHLRAGNDAADFEESPLVKIVPKCDAYPMLSEVDQIICAFNNTRVSVNKYVRKVKGLPEDEPVVGDRVISLMNSRKLKIYNGTQGVIKRISPHKMALMLSTGVTVNAKHSLASFNALGKRSDLYNYKHPFDYAYVVTCHKAQGSEWGRVLVIEQKSDLWDHKRWAYTAASRAKEELIWVID